METIYERENMLQKITDHIVDNTELVRTFGSNISIVERDGDYQGNDYYLLREGNKYGMIILGFGSCSGCDILQGMYEDAHFSNDFAELIQYRDKMYESIVWRTRSQMKEYILTKDFELEWYYHTLSGGNFVKQLKDYFK